MKEYAGKHFLLVVENNSVPFDKRVWREAKVLKEEGAKVTVICPIAEGDKKKSEIIDGINIKRFKIKFANGSKLSYLGEYITAFVKISLLVNKIIFSKPRPDVVHFANPPDIFWPLAIYLKLFGIRFIFDEHDLSPETFLSKYKISRYGGIFYRLLKYFEYLNYKYATTIISTNESYRQNAISIYPESLSKVFVVRNGPDTRYFHNVQKNEYLKKDKNVVLAYIGIMGVQDGVDYIINAAYYIINYLKFKDFIVYLIGSGDYTNKLKQLVSTYDLTDYVIFTGRIPDDKALEILSTADICLSPDPFNPLNNISTMNKIMEYMALGKPIVSFNLQENKYSAGNCALYVENNDITAFALGIMKLVNNPELREKSTQEARIRVDNELCWQKQIKHLIQAYNYTLNKSKPRKEPELHQPTFK